MSEPEADRPVLRVVRGEPTTEELAALVMVLTARPVARPVGTRAINGWTDRRRLVRACPAPAPGAWRRSGSP